MLPRTPPSTSIMGLQRSFQRTRVLVGLLGLGTVAVTGCSHEEPGLPSPFGAGASRPPSAAPSLAEPCSDGAIRDCYLTLDEQGDVLSCYRGKELCEEGAWSSCGDGVVFSAVMKEPGLREQAGERRPCNRYDEEGNLIEDAHANPCDPTCQFYVEEPEDPYVSEVDPTEDQVVDWTVGSIEDYRGANGLISKGMNEACRTGLDCQFNRYCWHPITEECAHGKCQIGAALDPECDPCVDMVCAEHPECCGGAPLCEEDSDCNDGNACTTDVCSEEGCQHEPVDCSDGDTCTFDRCDPASGCTYPADDCDDGDPCTVDSCTLTGCAHEAACNDGDPCTIDSCNASTGACSASPKCDDGNSATDDTCISGACIYTSNVTSAGILLEAECADNDGFDIDDSAQASNGEYAVSSHTKTSQAGNDRLTFAFEVATAGNYRVWGRVDAPGMEYNSFWVRMDQGTWKTWNDLPAGWTWDDVHDTPTGGSAVIYNLTAGSHSLVIANREKYTRLDKIYIAPSGQSPSATQTTAPASNCGGGPSVPTATGCVDNASCDDYDACTTDTCSSSGTCQYADVACNDANPCTVDICDRVTGCSHVARSCDDGDVCTQDGCAADGCASEFDPSACPSGAEGAAGGGGWNQACVDLVATACDAECDVARPSVCEGDPCEEGGPLAPGCHPFVTDVCAELSHCCISRWDEFCVAKMAELHSSDPARCDVVLESTGEEGLCVHWAPGETQASCDGIDLALDVPCASGIPVCNHGTQTKPAGQAVTLIYWSAYSQHYGNEAPDVSKCDKAGGECARCTTTEAIPPGQCVLVECALDNGNNAAFMVNPPSKEGEWAQLAECSMMDNWTLWRKELPACEEPVCVDVEDEAVLKKVNVLYMLDRSFSMSHDYGTNARLERWLNAIDALETFFADPGNAGMNVALEMFGLNARYAAPCKANVCQTGGALTASCHPYIADVCRELSSCCTTSWSSQCVNKMKALHGNSGCTEATDDGCAGTSDRCDGCSGTGAPCNGLPPSSEDLACAKPLLIGELTAASGAGGDLHEKALLDALPNQWDWPDFLGTPTLPALRGALAWATRGATAKPDEHWTVVLTTDGLATDCSTGMNFIEPDPIAQLALEAYLDYGVPTYVIGLEMDNLDDLDMIANAGGTDHAISVGDSGDTMNDLLTALQSIARKNAACQFTLGSSSYADPDLAEVTYYVGGDVDAAVELQRVNGIDSCVSNGWYFDDPTDPSQAQLCPSACSDVQADSAARLAVRIPCATGPIPETVTFSETYESSCPPTSHAIWQHLVWNQFAAVGETLVPAGASISFAARTGETAESLGEYLVVATAEDEGHPDSCTLGGPTPDCPVSLYRALGRTQARQPLLEVEITLNPSATGDVAVLNDWEVTFSCVEDE